MSGRTEGSERHQPRDRTGARARRRGRGSALEADAALIEQVIRIDLPAPLNLARATGRRMVGQRSGKIINVASLMSFQCGLDVAADATAKHGVAGLTKALAHEWATSGVQVNALACARVPRAHPSLSAAVIPRRDGDCWTLTRITSLAASAVDVVGSRLASPEAEAFSARFDVIDVRQP